MNSYKKLIDNTFIFAIGNLGMKLITFFLVPLYTYTLVTSEFGLVDLFTTTINFLMPLFTMSIFEAVLRYVMDRNYDKKVILNNAILVMLIGFIIFLILSPIIIHFLPFYEKYFLYFFVLLFIQAFQQGIAQYVRAQGMVRLFALNGIINALFLLLFNLIFLLVLKLGITGYLISHIISYSLSAIFVVTGGKVWKDFSLKKIDFSITNEMLRYSIPLLPNSLMWWIINFSGRFIITSFLGLGANGIYAVASRIPSLLSVVNSIFFQAWQISAIEEYDSRERSKFYSNVFNIFSITILLATSIILIFLKIILSFWVEESYFIAWKYVPFLLLAVVFSSYSGFIVTNYIAAKKTAGVFKTSVIGAIVNITVTLALVPVIGIYGAAVGTMVSFFVLLILMLRDTKGFVDLQINSKKLIITFTFLFIQIFVMYISFNFEILLQMILFLMILFANLAEIKLLSRKLFDSFVKRKG